jgi:hypothetical protein
LDRSGIAGAHPEDVVRSLAAWLCAAGCVMFAADRKPLPNQAGNDDIDIFATVVLDRQEIRQALGTDLMDGYALVRVRVVPKADQALRLGTNDFTLLSRKDGERSPALDPEQITGQAGLILKAAQNQPSRMSTVSNGPIWGGVKPTRSTSVAREDERREAEVPPDPEHAEPSHPNTPEENPLLAALKAKAVPEDESKKPLEGLLYFAIDGKPKVKDLALIYASPNGRLIVDFK